MQIASAGIRAGMDHVVVAGGTESLSTSPQVSKPTERGGAAELWMSPSHPETPDAPACDMSITVGENTAREMGLTRQDVDAWALYSTENALRSIDEGAFEAEIVPVSVTGPDGEQRMFSVDEHPRRGSSMESLAALPVLHPEIEGFTVTAGQRGRAQRRRRRGGGHVERLRRARTASRRWRGCCRGRRSGSSRARTGLGPTLAIPKALDRIGMSIDDIDLWEINEAFCSVPVAASRKLGIPQEIMNVNGSGASLGHPIACTGARMVVTMVNELHRRGLTFGCVSMCAGGGMGSALILEAL